MNSISARRRLRSVIAGYRNAMHVFFMVLAGGAVAVSYDSPVYEDVVFFAFLGVFVWAAVYAWMSVDACPDCDETIHATDRYCSECGAELEEIPYRFVDAN